MKVIVFGANGPVGIHTTRLALERGHTVTAVTRRPDAFPLPEHAQLTVARGDVLVRDDVLPLLEGHDAVIYMVGVPYTFQRVQVYSVGIAHVIEAMRIHGVRRLIGVTSMGTNPVRDWSEGLFWNLVLKSFVGATLYTDMRLMEAAVGSSGLDWTLVRPAQLIETEQVGDYRVAEGFAAQTTKTSRIDLASFLLDQLHAPDWVGKGVALSTAG